MSQFIRVVDGVLDAELCRRIIQRFEADEARGPGVTGTGVEPDKKLSTDVVISNRPPWADLMREVEDSLKPAMAGYVNDFCSMVVGAICPAVRHPQTGEPTVITVDNFHELGRPHVTEMIDRAYRIGGVKIQKYDRGIGGYPHWHSEVFPDVSGTAILRRVLFWSFYLNDVELGGETEFLYQGMKVQARAGRLLIAPSGFTHTHRGNVPRSSDKYIITSWLLFREAKELFDQLATAARERAAKNAAKRARRARS